MIRNAALIALALSLAAPAARGEEFGRLFLTPEQRAALDARRKAKVPDKPAESPQAQAPVKRVDGYVQRSGGRSTVWVNGEAAPEGPAGSGVRIRRGGAGETSVPVSDGEEARSASARVGQSVDTATGEIRDPLGDGQIKVRRTAEKPARGK